MEAGQEEGGTRAARGVELGALLLSLLRNPSSDLVLGWYWGSLTADSERGGGEEERERERKRERERERERKTRVIDLHLEYIHTTNQSLSLAVHVAHL